MKISTMEEALKRIDELEAENKKLNEELEFYKSRKLSGRKKHNEKWQAIYNDFVESFEQGISLEDIAKNNSVSVRTIYRYKAYYEEMLQEKDGNV